MFLSAVMNRGELLSSLQSKSLFSLLFPVVQSLKEKTPNAVTPWEEILFPWWRSRGTAERNALWGGQGGHTVRRPLNLETHFGICADDCFQWGMNFPWKKEKTASLTTAQGSLWLLEMLSLWVEKELLPTDLTPINLCWHRQSGSEHQRLQLLLRSCTKEKLISVFLLPPPSASGCTD